MYENFHNITILKYVDMHTGQYFINFVIQVNTILSLSKSIKLSQIGEKMIWLIKNNNLFIMFGNKYALVDTKLLQWK